VISTTQQAIVIASRGVRGDQVSLEIDGARAQRELAFATPVNGAMQPVRTSDLRTVTYMLSPPGQVPDPFGRGGLARREGDRYAIETAELMGGSAAGGFSTQLLAPEIIAIQFRYFDGTMWQTMWDSQSAGSLPRAIEVQIGFAPPPPRRIPWLSDATSRSSQMIRLVMYLPAADPVPEGMAQ
jgi:hypothetical protein